MILQQFKLIFQCISNIYNDIGPRNLYQAPYLVTLFQGRLEKNKVEEMLEGLLPGETVDTVSNLIFSTFDKDNRGSLSFVEFVSSIHCMSNSSPEVRTA